jgi:hypothetical protein
MDYYVKRILKLPNQIKLSNNLFEGSYGGQIWYVKSSFSDYFILQWHEQYHYLASTKYV